MMISASGASAVGLATMTDAGMVLDTWFPRPTLDPEISTAGTSRLGPDEIAAAFALPVDRITGPDPRRGVSVFAVRTRISDLAAPPLDIHDLYLRLHLLSHRLVRPHGLNLDGMAGMTHDVAWTSIGPCAPEQVEAAQWRGRTQGFTVDLRGIFRIPRMVDYVVPSGVSMSDADRVWLGAHLAPGTILTAEGFCGFNAGTLGRAMVEGRISSGVVVGEGTDIGGGASIMGTISGGGREVITVGRNCLLGANSGIGISIGDNCAVEAGCYVTAGVPVTLSSGAVVKAVALSGRPDLVFRRNGRTGQLEAVANTRSPDQLNPELHPPA